MARTWFGQTLRPTPGVSAGGAGPDHFPFQGFRDSGMGSQGIKNSLVMMTKDKTTARARLPRTRGARARAVW